MATAVPTGSDEQESAMLDRVLNRLVRTDDDKISAVLQKLLPMLVRKLDEGPNVRGKVINILSHISKRARPNSDIVLPCVELLDICRDVSPTSFAFNFALTFLEMGILRLPAVEQSIVAAKIAHGISRLGRYSQPQNISLHILLVVLGHLPLRGKENMRGNGATGDDPTTGYVERLSMDDQAVVMDWFLDICLYPGTLTRDGSVYHGLSSDALARLTFREKAWSSDVLRKHKLAVVRALKSDLIAPEAAVTPALAASCDTHHEVVEAAENFLKSMSSSDAARTLRQDSTVALNVLQLVLGETHKGHPAKSTPGDDAKEATVFDLSSARAPASPALAVRALAWLETECTGGTAARVPEAIRVSFMAMFAASAGSSTAMSITPRATSGVHADRSNQARLRAAGAKLAAFLASRCDNSMLPIVGPLLLQAVQRVLTINSTRLAESPGSPDDSVSGGQTGGSRQPMLAGSISLLAIQQTLMLEACYETIASLAGRRPVIFAKDTSVPRLLFSELSAREPGLRVNISAALGTLKSAYRGAESGGLASELWFLLWDAACSAEHRARLCAVEWACELFDFSDVAARHLCISLCDDKVTAVRSAALRGLSPPQRASLTPSVSTSAGDGASTTMNVTAQTRRFPSFDDFVFGVLRDDTSSAIGRGDGAAPPDVDELSPEALARALRFALECMDESTPIDGVVTGASARGEVPGISGEEAKNRHKEALDEYVSLIESVLERSPLATDGQHSHAQMVVLHRSAALALQRVVQGDFDGVFRQTDPPSGNVDAKGIGFRVAPAPGMAKRFSSRGQWLQGWLGHEGSIEIREAFAEVTGAAAVFMDPNTELVPLLRALGLKLRPPNGQRMASLSNRSVCTAHGAACGIGAVLSHLAHARSNQSGASDTWTILSEDAIPAVLSSLSSIIGHPITLLHLAACSAVGRIGAETALPLPTGTHGIPSPSPTPASGGTHSTGDTLDRNEENRNIVPGTRIRGEERITTIAAVFEKLWASCKLGETSDASRRAEAAAETLGRCCRGARKPRASEREKSVSQRVHGGHSERVHVTLATLFGMAKNQKEEELQFAVGAAVADVALSGPLMLPSDGIFESIRSSALAARRDLRAEAVADGSRVVIDAIDYVLYQVLYVLLEDHSPHVSGAAAVYLLAVLRGCKRHPLLGPYLGDIQAAFTRKLTVKSEFVQEVAGKGLALVYEAADGDARQTLVNSLVEALSTGRRRTSGSATGAVDVHGATHAGAVLSEAGTGVYSEMCAVANDVGRPDLIYSFLSMASHHAAWTTRRGASFGLGTMVKISTEAFSARLGRIVPRLFRYRYDPNGKTRSAMDQLWRSIISGDGSGDFSTKEKETIWENLSAIIAELLRAVGDRKWRDRQSACAGLADVLRGRSWDQLHPHLEELWIMADRALDDIKESVAQTAVDFAKTLANVSVRLCDPYSFLPPHKGDPDCTNHSSSADEATADAARRDAGGQGHDGIREEVGEARRSMETMVEYLRRSEAEAQARGEEGMRGLNSAGGREGAADEVLRRLVGHGEQTANEGRDAPRADEVVGRVLGGRLSEGPGGSVTPGRRGAERAAPTPPAAAREASAAALAIVLPWLLRKGILSRCKESQSLSIRTIQRLVKACDKGALTPHLAELVATLLEGLSALEPQALQYMQFHAETQLEMTQDQMERLRISMSRAGPLQDALDQCYRHLDAPGVVQQLMPRLLGLLRSGTGLATRSASAYLVLSLCERAPRETAVAAPRLLSTLTNTALSERSSTLIRTYSSALSSVARLASAPHVTRLLGRLVQLFREADPDFDKRQRRTVGLLLGDVCRRASAQLDMEAAEGGKGVSGGPGREGGNVSFSDSGWSRVLPIAFVARYDPDKPVADGFKEAWQEGLTQLQLGAAGLEEGSRVRTAKDAVLLMLPSILAELSAALSSISRVTKRQSCAGLKELASTLGPTLGEERSGRCLFRRVLLQIPGRVWEGKEELLQAVVALCTASKGYGVLIEPLVWGKSGAVRGARGAREVKRSRIEPAEAEEESDEESDEENDEELQGAVQGDSIDPGMSSASSAMTGTEGAMERVGDTSERREPSGKDLIRTEGDFLENTADADTDGTESVFRYEDKVGDFQVPSNAADGIGGQEHSGGNEAEGDGEGSNEAQQNAQHLRVSRTSRKGSRGDAEIEEIMQALENEDDSPVPFGEVVALILPQLKRKNTQFRRDAALSLAALLEAFPECCVYEMLAPTLLDLAVLHGSPTLTKSDPIMQARAVSCLAAAWPRMPPMSPSARTELGGGDRHETETKATSSAVDNREVIYDVQREYAASLTRALCGSIQQKVWSVRVPILDALSAMVSRTYVSPKEDIATSGSAGEHAGRVAESPLPSILTSALLADVVQAVEAAADDAKYSQVRARANSVVAVMASRKELRLALMPHKEGLMAIARAGAEDGEPRVALEGSKALENLMWWP